MANSGVSGDHLTTTGLLLGADAQAAMSAFTSNSSASPQQADLQDGVVKGSPPELKLGNVPYRYAMY